MGEEIHFQAGRAAGVEVVFEARRPWVPSCTKICSQLFRVASSSRSLRGSSLARRSADTTRPEKYSVRLRS